MRFVYSARVASSIVVYTSKREPIEIQPGGSIETTDEALIARLKSDTLFLEEKAPPMTEKRGPGRPRKVANDAG